MLKNAIGIFAISTMACQMTVSMEGQNYETENNKPLIIMSANEYKYHPEVNSDYPLGDSFQQGGKPIEPIYTRVDDINKLWDPRDTTPDDIKGSAIIVHGMNERAKEVAKSPGILTNLWNALPSFWNSSDENKDK